MYYFMIVTGPVASTGFFYLIMIMKFLIAIAIMRLLFALFDKINVGDVVEDINVGSEPVKHPAEFGLRHG